jgi:iron complex transport system ATP-binding protein
MKLRAENIAVGYGKKAVISKVNFSCETGQLIALMGLNGCGKSTLLNSLSGMQALLAGELFLDTEPVANWSLQEKAQRIAIVTTGRLQAANMTAFEVAAMGRYPYTGLFGKLKPQDIEIVEFSMQQCGLELLKNREFNTLSDGEQQRVLIARALAQQTPLIFLDEPTSYLDVRGKAEVLDLLQVLATNHLIVFSTHEVSLAPRVTTHFWLIDEESNFSSHTAKEVAENQLLEKLFYRG